MIALPGVFVICRLNPDKELPAWIEKSSFYSITRTSEELSIVTQGSVVPETVECEGDWRCLKIEGPLDFSMTGVMASVASPLAEAGISIFTMSTYNTDYLLVKQDLFEETKLVLSEAGHQIGSDI